MRSKITEALRPTVIVKARFVRDGIAVAECEPIARSHGERTVTLFPFILSTRSVDLARQVMCGLWQERQRAETDRHFAERGLTRDPETYEVEAEIIGDKMLNSEFVKGSDGLIRVWYTEDLS